MFAGWGISCWEKVDDSSASLHIFPPHALQMGRTSGAMNGGGLPERRPTKRKASASDVLDEREMAAIDGLCEDQAAGGGDAGPRGKVQRSLSSQDLGPGAAARSGAWEADAGAHRGPGTGPSVLHRSTKKPTSVLSPEHFVHIPRHFFQANYNVQDIVNSKLRVQILANSRVDPEIAEVQVANYFNNCGYSYYRLLGFKTTARKYAGWNIIGWEKVDDQTVLLKISSPAPSGTQAAAAQYASRARSAATAAGNNRMAGKASVARSQSCVGKPASAPTKSAYNAGPASARAGTRAAAAGAALEANPAAWSKFVERGLQALAQRQCLNLRSFITVMSNSPSEIRTDKGQVYIQKNFITGSFDVAEMPMNVVVYVNTDGDVDSELHHSRIYSATEHKDGKTRSRYLLRVTPDMRDLYCGLHLVAWSRVGNSQIMIHLTRNTERPRSPSPAPARGPAAAGRGGRQSSRALPAQRSARRQGMKEEGEGEDSSSESRAASAMMHLAAAAQAAMEEEPASAPITDHPPNRVSAPALTAPASTEPVADAVAETSAPQEVPTRLAAILQRSAVGLQPLQMQGVQSLGHGGGKPGIVLTSAGSQQLIWGEGMHQTLVGGGGGDGGGQVMLLQSMPGQGQGQQQFMVLPSSLSGSLMGGQQLRLAVSSGSHMGPGPAAPTGSSGPLLANHPMMLHNSAGGTNAGAAGMAASGLSLLPNGNGVLGSGSGVLGNGRVVGGGYMVMPTTGGAGNMGLSGNSFVAAPAMGMRHMSMQQPQHHFLQSSAHAAAAQGLVQQQGSAAAAAAAAARQLSLVGSGPHLMSSSSAGAHMMQSQLLMGGPGMGGPGGQQVQRLVLSPSGQLMGQLLMGSGQQTLQSRTHLGMN